MDGETVADSPELDVVCRGKRPRLPCEHPRSYAILDSDLMAQQDECSCVEEPPPGDDRPVRSLEQLTVELHKPCSDSRNVEPLAEPLRVCCVDRDDNSLHRDP